MSGEGGIDLTCYIYSGWRPRIRAASQRRAWMDGTPESFAYRCLPLNIANAHGWELLSPCGFDAEWNGGTAVDDVVIRTDPGASGQPPVALFGQGVLTFHVDGLFRTPAGYNLWVGGPPNAGKDGIAPLGGIIETDWSPYSFTMNWRFTRPGQVIRFEENEPFCFLFPVERRLVETVKPRIAPIEEAPELKRQFEQWSASRDHFRAEVEANPPATPAEKWQKLYYRGVDADGKPGPADHRAKLRLAEFEGAADFHREARPLPACPAGPASPSRGDSASAEKLEWLLGSFERLRAMSAGSVVQRKAGVGTQEFLDAHYAPNWPVLLAGAVEAWPARTRWTPDYLKTAVGSRSVQVQANRGADADYERNMAAHTETLAFDAFIDRISKPDAGNDTYLTASNSAANAEALSVLHGDLGFLDAYLTRQDANPHGMMWIGPAGTFTPLHHDLTNNLILQLVGRKVVLMAAPGETPKLYNDLGVYSRIRNLAEPDILSQFPKLEGIRIHRVMLNPGDALFVPLGWWHQVTSLDFSVTITHTNFRWPNDFHTDYPG
ncbi:MAG TPA: DUF6065 family protein [Phenylobacterium sp.]